MKTAMRDMLAIAVILFLLSVGIGHSQSITVIDKYGNNVLRLKEVGGSSGPAIATIKAPDGTVMVLMNGSEYAHLQALRKAVSDEETRLAQKYGAVKPCVVKRYVYCYLKNDGELESGSTPGDHYEYHGQFLLIERKTKP